MLTSRVLAVFAKTATPGRVKTRLIGPLSPSGAADIHRACLDDTLALTCSVEGTDPCVFFDGPWQVMQQARAKKNLLPMRGVGVFSQLGRNLGERLENACRKLFGMGYRQAVIVGTDTPWMGEARIRMALAALNGADVVVGPCRDGGYYLVGAQRFVPELFREIPWGTREVLIATRRKLARSGVEVHLLPWDFDLDRPEDLRRAADLLGKQPWRAPALASLLEAWKQPNKT